MNKNIDLAKILENCPKGFPLYSIIYGTVTFSRIVDNAIEFMYSHETLYGIYKATAYVNLKGKHIGSYNGERTLFPSKDQRDWSKFNAPWYKKKKFDPKTLKEFDRILGWNPGTCKWECNLFSNINDYAEFNFKCFGVSYKYCIPYNDDTKHIVGTKEEAPEYYKYWED